jgi:hypothetical protein
MALGPYRGLWLPPCLKIVLAALKKRGGNGPRSQR